MARRHIYPRNGYELREPPPSSSRQPPPPSHHVSRHSVPLHHLEDRVAIQHREIQSLLLENQRLGATHVALKQELSRAQQELRHLSSTAADVKAERDAEVRQVYEKSLKLDAEARVIDAMKAEMNQVRGDIEHLGAVKQDLIKRLDEINGELAKERADSKEVTVIKAEIDNERQEIQRGRAAIENEMKNRASNLEHSQVMEKNIMMLGHEIERLRAELANAEKRARAAAAAAAAANPSASYVASYVNPDTGYGGNPYPNPYGMQQCPQFQVQGTAGVVHPYTPIATSHMPYEMQGSNVTR